MSWRTVIHLNLVRSVNRILDVLENAPEMERTSRVNLLRMRLSPLCRVQHDLEMHLGLAGAMSCTPLPTTGSSDVPPRSAFVHGMGGPLRSVLPGRRQTTRANDHPQKMHWRSS